MSPQRPPKGLGSAPKAWLDVAAVAYMFVLMRAEPTERVRSSTWAVRLDWDGALANLDLVMTDQLPPTALAQELADGLRSVLGPDLLAVYLHGSVVAGDFVPGVSDIDLLVVVERDLDDSTTERLRSFHARAVARHPDWQDRLELVYVGWISDFCLVRESGVTVFGPPPPDTIPPISWTEFVAEIRRYADEVAARDLRDATPASRAYCVLTMCRALATIHEEQPCSKEKAATLVRTWMPEWAWLIDEAEGCRLARGRSGLASDRMVEKAAAFIALLAGSIDIG